MTTHCLFVYGTLQPGDVRWEFLRPFAVGEGRTDSLAGDLYDTGCGYPAAIFADDARYRGGTIHGRTFELLADRVDEALELLDEEEGTVGGLYRRIRIRTSGGIDAWAYTYGDGLELTPIPDGRWKSATKAATVTPDTSAGH